VTEEQDLSDVERALQARFNPTKLERFTSTALEPKRSELVQQLALPEDARGRMPMTQEKFATVDNPQRVEWERHVRYFLKQLRPREQAHRITAPMIFEWTTGISIKELAEAEGVANNNPRGGGATGSANSHLRHINAILKEYFGTPYKTKIAGREVGKAYKVRAHFRVERKQPACITLKPEFEQGILDQ